MKKSHIYLILLILITYHVDANAGILDYVGTLFSDIKEYLYWLVSNIFEAIFYWVSVVILKSFDIIYGIYSLFNFGDEYNYFYGHVVNVSTPEVMEWLQFFHFFGMLSILFSALPVRMLVKRLL